MAGMMLPLSHTRSFKLTIADREILSAASEQLGISEAEVLRIALRRWALLDENNGLPAVVVERLAECCGALPIGPATASTLDAVRSRQQLLTAKGAREGERAEPLAINPSNHDFEE